MDCEGFIVHSYSRTVQGATRLYFLGCLSDGRTFAVVEDREPVVFYVRDCEAEKAGPAARQSGARLQECGLRTLDGEPCRMVLCATQDIRASLKAELERLGVRTYEADLRPTDQYRLSRGIRGQVHVSGESRPGRVVDLVFVNPRMQAAEGLPRLSLLSLDIETDVRSSEILAIGLVHRDPFREQPREEVLFGGPELDRPEIECLEGEKNLLLAFRRRVRELDPDIITGWNVVDFDFRMLAARFLVHGIPFRLGRSREPGVFFPPSAGRGSRVILPGRQVWDAIRIVRASPEGYEDYSLETVAEAVLGYGKSFLPSEGEGRVEALERLRRQDPVAFCLYCLQDARLVHEILAKTGLFELTVRRCQLLGVAPDLAWTSIPAFEHLYTEALHARGMVAPSAGVDHLPMGAAPGGAILTPRPGVFDDVLLFDFQSLYPSIIRSFNIDPVSYVREPVSEQDLIVAPNGARFRREPAILPQLLDRFFESRREAQAQGDAIASFVYKIIMNSFYGVLGASGCRFAGSELAGAVTSFGQQILGWCRDFLEARGLQVLYGDTDSLFVAAEADTDGEALAREVGEAVKEHLGGRYRVQPRLTLRFEKHYLRFLLPPLRGAGSAGRGRAKGYAGLLAPLPAARPRGTGPDASLGDAEDISARIEVKGMEAVRRDWTDLAHDFQLRLLELLFLRRPLEEIRDYCRSVVHALYEGRLDDKLVYRKALRKPLSDYTRSTPPHARAAALLEPAQQRGLIRYVVTREGPQPEGLLTAAIDYDHYVEKQLEPIAATLTEVLGVDPGAILGSDRQLWLL
ncbi:MAG: DNA polymerase II [Spirochaetales bacterium]|nr:DNA polymerase II [Spirochaetales bacterium]